MLDTLRENKKIISLVIIGVITVTMFLIFIYSYYTRDTNRPSNVERSTMSLKAREIINEKRHSNNLLSEVSKSDLSNILVVEGADVELINSEFSKSGDSSNTESSRISGLNSAIVTSYKGKMNIYNSNILTNAVGANAIYSSGTQAFTGVNETEIKTLSPSSSALLAANKGTINGNHLTITTKAPLSPALDSLTSDSTIYVTNSLLETNGALSPIINASGITNIEKSTGSSTSSPIAILKDSGDVYIKESVLIAAAGSVPEGFTESGILIYGNDPTSMNPQKFVSMGSSLNIDKNYPFYKTAPLLNIVNTNAKINLTRSSLSFGSGILANIKNSNVTLYASGQNLIGDIIMDETSTLEINLKYESQYESAINNKKISINLGINSKLILKADTHLGNFYNEDITNNNIEFNGHHLYANDTEITQIVN